MPKQCSSSDYTRRLKRQKCQAGYFATRYGGYICGCRLPPLNGLTNDKRSVLRIALHSPAGQPLPALPHRFFHPASFLKSSNNLPEASTRQLRDNLDTTCFQGGTQLRFHLVHNVLPIATGCRQRVSITNQPWRGVKQREGSHRFSARLQRASLLPRCATPTYSSFNCQAGERGDALWRRAEAAEQ